MSFHIKIIRGVQLNKAKIRIFKGDTTTAAPAAIVYIARSVCM